MCVYLQIPLNVQDLLMNSRNITESPPRIYEGGLDEKKCSHHYGVLSEGMDIKKVISVSKEVLTQTSCQSYIMEFDVKKQLNEILHSSLKGQLLREEVWSDPYPSTCVVMMKNAVLGPHVLSTPCDEKILVHCGDVEVLVWPYNLVRTWPSTPGDHVPYSVISGFPAPTVLNPSKNEVINLKGGSCCVLTARSDTSK